MTAERGRLTTVIARVVSVAAHAIAYQRPQWFEAALDTLVRIYKSGFDTNGLNCNDGTSEDLWLVVLEHVLALGALATRKHDWVAVRTLATTPPDGESNFFASWLRHALTMASRSQRLDDAKALVTRAAERIDGLPALRPDVAPGDEEVIMSICQFDILVALAVIAATQDTRGSGWYPNFARFYSSRSEPAVKQLLTDRAMRDVIFPLDDADLATALREIERLSRNEGFRFAGWDGFNTTVVRDFLSANPEPARS